MTLHGNQGNSHTKFPAALTATSPGKGKKIGKISFRPKFSLTVPSLVFSIITRVAESKAVLTK